ncbi:C1 family peptidase [Methanobrevibacter sp.]|uniref:C1 family peptidase n=1 Tax=Methanobrevibacter sp. TaxID=66852 RepID=UPI0038699E9A
MTFEQDCQLGDDEGILLESNYYFDESNVNPGNGTYENPYRTFSINSIKDNSAVYFAEGEYYFDRDASFSNISFYGENSQNTILNGNGRTLTITGSVNFKNITLTNLKLVNRNTLNASNTVFKSLIAYSSVYGNSYGGGIYSSFKNANIAIDNCTFSDNSAQYGGAIYMAGGSLKIINSLFINNVAYNFGGAIAANSNSRIFINNTRFINDKSTNDAGGAIYIESSSLESFNMSVVNSTSTFGPAITALSSNLVLVNFTAENNSAKYDGGAIYQVYGTINLNSSRFISNSANNGGALFIYGAGECNLASNEFTINRADSHAGAIYSLFNNEINLTDSIFTNNSALFYNDTFQTSQISLIFKDGNLSGYVYNETIYDTLPDYYNLNEHGYVTSVKDQQDGGNCWAFAALASLESCILKAGGEVFDFSEENMKNLVAKFSYYGRSYMPNSGGNDDMAIGYLASWLGPVNESDDLYDGQSQLSALLNNAYHVQNVLYLKRNNYTDNDLIKQAILKYGAVSTFLYMGSIAWYNGEPYHYYTGDKDPNHAVAIVGWNDSFYVPNAPGLGAWIVKNSWGNNWGKGGYFYVSYYDTVFAQPGVYSSFTFIINDSSSFDKNYQYDVSFPTDYFWYDESSIWCKNVFNATDNEFLEAVSTFFDGDTDWELYINVNGELKLYKNGSCVKGYFTINLDYPIPIAKGDIFEVEFKMNGDGKSSFAILEGFNFNKVTYPRNVSFVSFDGENWFDLFDFKFQCLNHIYTTQVASVKAFTRVTVFNSTIKSLDISHADMNLFNLVASVVDENGYLVGNGNMTFIVNGQNVTVGVERGIASISIPLSLGENDIRLFYESVNYRSSTYDSIYNVVPVNLGIDINVEQELNNVSVTVTLSQALNSTILISVNGNVTEAKTVNGICQFNLSNLKYGNYSVNVTFNSFYLVGENSTDFFVDYKDTHFEVNDVTTFYCSGLIYYFTLFDEFGDALNNSQVRFILNNQTYYNTTDAQGRIFLALDLPLGDYPLEVFFEGDRFHSGCRGSALVSVLPSRSWLNITGVSYDSFNLFNISVSVFDQLNRTVDVGNLTFTVNNIGYGNGNMIPFVVGLNNVTVSFEDVNYLPSSAVLTYEVLPIGLDMAIDVFKDFNNAYITINLSQKVNESLLIDVNGNITKVKTSDGIYQFNLTSLSYGNYNITVEIDSDFYAGKNSTELFVDVKKTYFEVKDFTTVYNSGEYFTVRLFDELNHPVAGREVRFSLNDYVNITDAQGWVGIPVWLADSINPINISFAGDGSYIGCENASTVTVVSSIALPANAVYTYGAYYEAYLLDKSGNPLGNAQVTFAVNDVNYQTTSGNDGIAALAIPIYSGNAIVNVTNPQTGEVKSQTIQILPRLVENEDVIMYYGKDGYYKVKVLNDYGQAVGAGEIVAFSFKSIVYYVKTASDGYASFKLTSKAGTFAIMASYKGFDVSNKITIKPTLITKDKSVKKFKKFKYSAKLLNTEGVPLKGKKITFKFKGKKYYKKTNKKGIAKISIKNKYKSGKYKIVAKYENNKSKSFITIKE